MLPNATGRSQTITISFSNPVTNLSFNLFDIYRMDLFLDYARGRDPESANIWHDVTGTGIRVNLRTPRSTILQVDAGRSFLPEIYRGAGSFVLQVLLLKPL